MIDIYVWATDSAGCWYQRLKLPLDALAANYPDEFNVCWTCEPKPGTDEHPSVVLGQRIMGNGADGDARWLEFCRDPRYFAVYEIDDDILDLDPGNAVPYSIFTPNRAGTVVNVVESDFIVASTKNLAEKLRTLAPGGPVGVAPNCVADGSVVERNPDRGGWPLTIGWAGSMFHQQDFTPELVGQLAAVRDAFPDVHWQSIGANYLGWGSTFGWGPIETYHQRLNFIDIGIAPIARTPFNASKSWIKALDYMAHGVVPVVENWGQYPELIGDPWDRGRIVPAGQWTSTLSTVIEALTDDGSVIDHAGIAARAREFEISNQVHIWADAFRRAYR